MNLLLKEQEDISFILWCVFVTYAIIYTMEMYNTSSLGIRKDCSILTGILKINAIFQSIRYFLHSVFSQWILCGINTVCSLPMSLSLFWMLWFSYVHCQNCLVLMQNHTLLPHLPICPLWANVSKHPLKTIAFNLVRDACVVRVEISY